MQTAARINPLWRLRTGWRPLAALLLLSAALLACLPRAAPTPAADRAALKRERAP